MNHVCRCFQLDYADDEEACAECNDSVACLEGVELLKSIPLLELRELPEYLAHTRESVRAVAKERLDGLCIRVV